MTLINLDPSSGGIGRRLKTARLILIEAQIWKNITTIEARSETVASL
jgi:hypothetical protein